MKRRSVGGLGVEETAEVLDVSPERVMRDWGREGVAVQGGESRTRLGPTSLAWRIDPVSGPPVARDARGDAPQPKP